MEKNKIIEQSSCRKFNCW